MTTWRAGLAVVAVASLVACGGGGSDDVATGAACDRPPSDEPAPAVTAGPTTPDRTEPLPPVEVDPAEGRTPPSGFGEVSVEVVDRPAGAPPVPLCLLLAETGEQRSRGLMGVVDPALGGYDGMLFVHDSERPPGSAYWMRSTPLPLSLAFLDDTGAVVDTAELEPCPPDEVECPTYPSSAAFTMVLEVVRGGLGPRDLEAGSPARIRVLG